MICILLHAAYIMANQPYNLSDITCDEKKCAQYDEHMGRCGLISGNIAQSIQIARQEESQDEPQTMEEWAQSFPSIGEQEVTEQGTTTE